MSGYELYLPGFLKKGTTVAQIIYRGYGDKDECETMQAFVVRRVNMVAPLLGGARDVAIDYTWSVSDDGGYSYRNPTGDEKNEFYAALWDYRSTGMDCARDCQARGRFDGIWRCMTCNAVWTEPEGGMTYGVPLNPSALRVRIEEVKRDASQGQRDYQTPTMTAILNSSYTQKIEEDYSARLASGQQDRLIMDVQLFMGLYYRFLVVHGEEGGWYALWVSAI